MQTYRSTAVTHRRLIVRILGVLLASFSLTMIPPIVVSLIYRDGEAGYFLMTLAILATAGLFLWFPNRNIEAELRPRDGLVVVTLFWTVLGLVSSLPFVLSPTHNLTFTDAVFEAVSGFTTAGATVLTGLEELPKSLLYYRAQLHFLGGMGIVVLAMAVLPMLGVGGMELYRAETPGPMKDEKLTPRIMHTARALWIVYVGLTAACALAYWLEGMSAFDAICHAYSTVATGGFGNYDDSFAHFRSPLLEWTACVFMLLGGLNFGLHFLAFRRRSLRVYAADGETRYFLFFVVVLVALVAVQLTASGYESQSGGSLRLAAFQVISIITTTGFTTDNFSAWPSFLPLLLIYVSFVGGAAGSTAGGVKVLRVMLVLRQAARELGRMVHPRAVVPVRINGRPVSERILSGVWAFFALYTFTTTFITLLLVATGLDIISAFSAVAACLNVMGPGLGVVSSHMIELSDTAIWIMSATMLIGRLEIFTVFVLLTPAFWRD